MFTWLTRTARALARLSTPPGAARPLSTGTSGGWFAIVREANTGDWQRNIAYTVDSVIRNPTVFACTTLIANDIAKLRLDLVEQTELGVWEIVTNPAYSPVLRKPNRWQTLSQFMQSWVYSKLLTGNTYVLKQRDTRGVVIALAVLDPARVTPLVAPDGAVYYELRRDDLGGVIEDEAVTVPASEIIHDRINALFHPLCGLSPIFAAGLAATQGIRTVEFLTTFIGNGSRPSGVLMAPTEINTDQAKAIQTNWQTQYGGSNSGKVAVLQNGMKYEAITMTNTDAQVIETLRWSAEAIAPCYGVPPYFVVPGAPAPPYTSPEMLFQQYHGQCIQIHTTAMEQVLDEGLELRVGLGTEFNIDDLVWMDTATKTKAAADGIQAGVLTVNEARRKYFGLGPVEGGDTPYLQQQYFSLAALAERDAMSPFAKTPAPVEPLPTKAIAYFEARLALLERAEAARARRRKPQES